MSFDSSPDQYPTPNYSGVAVDEAPDAAEVPHSITGDTLEPTGDTAYGHDAAEMITPHELASRLAALRGTDLPAPSSIIGEALPEARENGSKVPHGLGAVSVSLIADADNARGGQEGAADARHDPSPADPKAGTEVSGLKAAETPAEPPGTAGDGPGNMPPISRPTPGGEAEGADDEGTANPAGTPAPSTIGITTGLFLRLVSAEATDQIRNIPIGALKEIPQVHTNYLAVIGAALNHPHAYQHTISTVPAPDNSGIEIPDLLGTFYGRKREDQRADAYHDVYNAGFRIAMNADRTPNEVVAESRNILNGTYQLANNLTAVHRSRASIPYFDQLTGMQKVIAKQALSTVDAQGKPPVLAEYMKQYIPRFAWHPHPLPDAPIPPGYENRLQELWSGYSPADANLLISADQLAEGKAPFHMGMAAAKTVEAEGHNDLGYHLRTGLILQTHKMEASHFEGTETPDIPFFNYILPGAMTGAISSVPKGAHCDYLATIVETMEQTWSRVAQETRDGAPGVATNFITKLNEGYGNDLPPYLARSMSRHAERANFDVVSTLKGLRDNGVAWAPAMIDGVAALPSRPLLTNEEVDAFASQAVPDPAATHFEAGEAARAATSLSAGADIYSFKVALAKVANVTNGAVATMTVDIDTGLQKAEATINHRTNGTTRSLAMSMDLTDGAVAVNTIDSEPLDPQTVAKYRTIVEKAIVGENARVTEAQQAADAPPRDARGGATTTPAATTASPVTADRESKVKTRGVPTEQAEPDDAVSLPAEDETRGKVQIVGMGEESVAEMLHEQKISEISPQVIMQRVARHLDAANNSNRSFGKRPSLGSSVEGSDRVKLRQLGWVADGGHRQLRLYFRERAGGKLELYGIYDKKGAAHQMAYLKKLVKKINQQDQRERTEEQPSGPRKRR